MPHSFGYRARTRDLFSRKFRQRGTLPTSAFMKELKVGDYVDIVANSAVHGGMPHKTYHGRTGVVFNVSRRAVGVEVNKQVRQRILKKRIHVKAEHVRQSKCRQMFLERVKRIESAKRQAKEEGRKLPKEAIKRIPRQPKEGYVVKAVSAEGSKPIVVYPLPFDDML
eukprot:CAMPEP_0117039102 /NCGR_PEP_ID=MMETSP0472-20121206/27474_1 /TAXON_ID=693140 ORGANISM="Tiarina fusus, Strain LIS" /NCGR_SAMPLE_ID=MMETSP0472 /ASSEMBLY_ACC=CAM_ASM_000603 /LENGTH=166 /DNA_ID=CAMNT_0004749519 /DNA_START=6 /DNA_END=506 /DNA_ORIENTATION=-